MSMIQQRTLSSPSSSSSSSSSSCVSKQETLASLHTERIRIKNEMHELQSQVNQLEQLVNKEKTKLTYSIASLAQIDARIADIQNGNEKVYTSGLQEEDAFTRSLIHDRHNKEISSSSSSSNLSHQVPWKVGVNSNSNNNSSSSSSSRNDIFNAFNTGTLPAKQFLHLRQTLSKISLVWIHFQSLLRSQSLSIRLLQILQI